ncbi:MAG: TFIIB-type zinc ribbon-containing protein [Clostridia bacterium]|nr:TFIIB-type zinc ribbon-containing protein [Clostridia bacterium]
MGRTTVTYQCPNCGAGLLFDAEKGRFSCEFCLSDFSKQELDDQNSAEKAKVKEEQDAQFRAQLHAYHCPSCGADVMADGETVADFCYYCHNPVVLSDQLSGAFRPDKVIPFRFGKQQAIEKFLKYAKSHRFVPRDYFSAEQVELITGVYYPFWVTDADSSASLHTQGTRLRSWVVGNVKYTETTKLAYVRDGEIHFEDIVTGALSTEDKEMLEGILPYPSESLEEFSMPYLTGFIAKKRDIEREELSEEVRSRMEGYARRLLRGTIEGQSDPGELQLNIRHSNWEYALMPVWVLNYSDKEGNIYRYAMNGYTGKVYGELPISKVKLAALFTAVMAAVAAVVFALGWVLL